MRLRSTSFYRGVRGIPESEPPTSLLNRAAVRVPLYAIIREIFSLLFRLLRNPRLRRRRAHELRARSSFALFTISQPGLMYLNDLHLFQFYFRSFARWDYRRPPLLRPHSSNLCSRAGSSSSSSARAPLRLHRKLNQSMSAFFVVVVVISLV